MKTASILPFTFDKTLLQHELVQVTKTWNKHFNSAYFTGDWSGITIRGPQDRFHELSAGNDGNDQFIDDPMLHELPYTSDVINMLKTRKKGIRYLRLGKGSAIKSHRDHDLVFWDGFARLHIPVLTNDQVFFTVGDLKLHMKEGECWFADFSRPHSVENNGNTDRIHLVIDCEVNNWLKELFIREEIIGPTETSPDQLDRYNVRTQMQIIESLEAIGTEKSFEIAQTIRDKLKG